MAFVKAVVLLSCLLLAAGCAEREGATACEPAPLSEIERGITYWMQEDCVENLLIVMPMGREWYRNGTGCTGCDIFSGIFSFRVISSLDPFFQPGDILMAELLLEEWTAETPKTLPQKIKEFRQGAQECEPYFLSLSKNEVDGLRGKGLPAWFLHASRNDVCNTRHFAGHCGFVTFRLSEPLLFLEILNKKPVCRDGVTDEQVIEAFFRVREKWRRARGIPPGPVPK